MKDAKGRFAAGPLSVEERKAISEGQVRRHLRHRLEVADAHVEQKRCTQCKEWRKIPEEYVMRKRKLVSGEIRHYAAGECKYCGRSRAERWKKDFVEKHGEQAWKDRQTQYRLNRDQQKRRRYQREYGRIRRIEEGVTPRGPWKKYRDEPSEISKVFVSSTPLRLWWESLDPKTRHWVNQDPDLSRNIRRYSYEHVNTEISLIDHLVDKFGDPGLYNRLAPGL